MSHKLREKQVHKTVVIQCHRHGDDSAEYELTQVNDISTSGMLFHSARFYAQNELLDISINLPAFTKPICVLAKVVRCDDLVEGCQLGYAAAVRFVQITPEIKSALEYTVDFFWGKQTTDKVVVGKNTPKLFSKKRPMNGRAKRAAIGLFFRYRHINSTAMPILGYSINMSRSGLLCQTESPYPVNELVELEFKFPILEKPVRFHARVARCVKITPKMYHTALKYNTIPEKVRFAMNAVLYDKLVEREYLVN